MTNLDTDPDHFVSWLHIGDLHASDEDGWESLATLARIVDDVRRQMPGGALAFAYLPGDNANHGERAQYRRIADILDRLPLPCHAIPGDHDFEPGSLAVFREELAPPPLPRAVVVNGRRVLLLDIVSAGSGGPDFRLGTAQTAWLRGQLDAARAAGGPGPVVLMHAFPGDLREGGQALGRMLADARVAFVDTGHTHYNELLNDGAVVYSATRSTGQVEEGEAGFAIAAVDGDRASWRFKPLGSGWSFVLITAPADARLAVAGPEAAPSGPLAIHALVLGREIARVEATLGDEPPVAMRPCAGRPGLWTAAVARPPAGAHRLAVQAFAADASAADAAARPLGSGRCDRDEIRFQIGQDVRASGTFGEHAHTVGAWAHHGVLGTRLGPNANGRHW